MKANLLLMLLITNCVMGQNNNKSLHDFTSLTIEGKEFNMNQLKGKKVLVVNTASKCGLTPQYKGLQSLYEKYGGEDFTIIGFPANNFLWQEPGTEEEIAAFCSKNYGVTFQMMHKVSVKGGNMDPIYQWLTKKEYNGVKDASVSWNFQKFLIDSSGNWVGVADPTDSPDCEQIISWIEEKNN